MKTKIIGIAFAVAIVATAFTSCKDKRVDELTKTVEEQSQEIEDLKKQLDAALAEAPTINGIKYVDLGLSVNWAATNVGAKNPEDYGYHVAWGEVYEKDEEYNPSTTKYFDNATEEYKKYGLTDSDTTLLPEDDAATYNCGMPWRTPSNEELNELLTKCNISFMSINGVFGACLTGPNGKSIFLPTAGYKEDDYLDINTEYASSHFGYYWSSRVCYAMSIGATYNDVNKTFEEQDCEIYSDQRHYGQSVRAVCDK